MADEEEYHLTFIPLTRVHEYLPLGWVIVKEMPQPHGQWSLLGRWEGEGEPKIPERAML